MTKRREAKLGPKGRPYGGSAGRTRDDVKCRRQGIGRTDARASEHPVVVGRTDAMILWCRRESKRSQPIGTG